MDLALGASIALLFLAAGWPGIGVAGLLALAVLAGRAVASAGAATARRRRQPGVAPLPPPREARRIAPTPAQRALRVVTICALVTGAAASVSLVQALTTRSSSSVGIRAVEWLRDNGGAGVVSTVENWYYSLSAPAKGGPALHSLPSVGIAQGLPAKRARARLVLPPQVRPVIHPALPGEGVWRPVRRWRPAGVATPPVLETTYRPDPSYPRVVAGLARIDPRHARLALYPGLQEPPAGGSTRPAEVPAQLRPGLLATFNSGFKHKDGGGGFYAAGQLFEPLQPGLGTIVGTRDGRVDVRAWTGGAHPPGNVLFARQNLPLIVDHGRLNPQLSDGPEWGATLGNAVLVWRSAVGVDRHGDLIYAAANDQSVKGIARILVHAGAVRAIELDINSYWVSFNAYARSDARNGRTLLPTMDRPASRYLTPDDRDFFAVYGRR